eukprot:Rmarinus@m.15437
MTRKGASACIKDGWFSEKGPMWKGQAMTLEVEEVLFDEHSKYQDVLVFKSVTYGTVLVLDGVIQATERDEFAYQEMIAHLPLCSHPNPEKVLVVGGGDGGVLREIARHDCVKEIHICELDQMVIDVSKKYLPCMARGFNDARVHVHIQDGAEFMKTCGIKFDVIIVDSSDPVGPAEVLFKKPFYEGMRDALTDEGIVCTQGECMWLHLDLIGPMLEFCTDLFASAEYAYTTIPTYPSGQIGFILCRKSGAPCSSEPRKFKDEVQGDLRYYNPAIHKASFVLPEFCRRAIAKPPQKKQASPSH